MPPAQSTDPSDDPAVPTLERPLYLLTFFTAKEPVWTLSGLSRASGLPSASCLRAIRVLEKYQFLRRDHMQYRLGSQLVRLSANAMASSPSRRLALPHLEHLHRLTGLAVSWSVLESQEALTLEVVASPEHPAERVQVGAALDLSAGAVSRVLLAFAPQEVRRSVLASLWAEHPHTRPHQELLDGLTRKAWLALEVSRQPADRCDVAAPVFQGDGRLVASVGLERSRSMPPSRAVLEQELGLLNQAAQRISRDLGYTREWQGDPAFFLQILESVNILAFTEASSVGNDLVNYPI
ncbi:hypothetical protein K7W42_03340 [Deinococcus sp. HMF7604]|uniref:IclR family transcriptional regulator n=2 Tax=Deinococcus TaxID=1298 RepID=UPI001CCAB147|nr:helix-turn-helix domain-containing protein [Deinococcus betulae]MBZ9749893.1 hypothetical protein [Deinococcus betulae]